MKLNMVQRVILILFCASIVFLCVFFVPLITLQHDGHPYIFIGYHSAFFVPGLEWSQKYEIYGPIVDIRRLGVELAAAILFFGVAFLAFSGEIKKSST